MEKIYAIARQGEYVMHIQLEDWRAETRSIEYLFVLDGPATDYTLHLTHLRGNLPDAMSNHTGMRFSTKDRDNDNHEDSNCAHNYTGEMITFYTDMTVNNVSLQLKPDTQTLKITYSLYKTS